MKTPASAAPQEAVDDRASRPWWLIAAVVGLLVLHAGLAFSAAAQKSLTYDELAHLVRGVTVLRTGDFGKFPHTSPADLWMAIPAAASPGVQLPEMPPSYPEAESFDLGDRFVFEMGNDPLLLRVGGRCMMILVSVALGLLIFMWSYRLFGSAGGLISLSLYALSPTVLAHAWQMHADVVLSFFALASAGALWRCFRCVSPWTVAISGLLCALALLTKLSGSLVVPLAVLLGIVRIAWPGAMRLRWGRRGGRLVTTWLGRTAVVAGLAVAHAMIGVLVIWCYFGLQYDAIAGDAQTMFHGQGKQAILQFFAEYRLLPEAFLVYYGMYLENTSAREAFLLGRHSVIGWWYFFPAAFAVKTALGVWLAMLLAGWRGWQTVWGGRYRSSRLRRRRLGIALLRTAPLWLLAAVYLAAAMSVSINIGHRHILVIYLALFILAGVLGKGLPSPRLVWRRRPMALLCLAILAIESFWIWPHYLAFFNLAAGGPDNGYRLLVDSSLDWGQDLPLARDYLKRHAPHAVGPAANPQAGSPVYFAYFGTDRPEAFGIHAQRLGHDRHTASALPLEPGLMIVSATYLQSVYIGPPGQWQQQDEAYYQQLLPLEPVLLRGASTAARRQLVQRVGVESAQRMALEFHSLRLGRLMAYLKARGPDDRIGYTMFAYNLTEQDLHQAFHGEVPVAKDRPRGIDQLLDSLQH